MAFFGYQLVTGDSSDVLSGGVQQALAEGWQPYGPAICIQLVQTHKRFQLIQAMVRGTPDGGAGAPITTANIADATETGKALMTIIDADAARTAIGAGTSSFSGSYDDLSNKPTIPAAPVQGDAAKLQAGTDATPSLWTAKMIHDEIKRQVAEAA